MEYSRTFKGEQGVGLEMKVKVEGFTEESMREALSLIAQSSHRFYLDTAKVCKDQMASEETGAKEELENQMEAAKPPQEPPASDGPDFVWKPDVKYKGNVENFGGMSLEKFEQLLQECLNSHPRCTFAEGSGSSSAGESLTAEGAKMSKEEPAKPKRHSCDVLMDLATKISSILVKAAMEILENNTQAKYVELAVLLLNDALKYDSFDSHARGYDESIRNAAEALRSKREVNVEHP